MTPMQLFRRRRCRGTSNLQCGRSTRGARHAALAIAGALFLGGMSSVPADDNAEARLKGADKAAPVRIAEVKCKPAGVADQSIIAFDLAWAHSWRVVPAVAPEQHGGTGAPKLESWDAAWVFVKFRRPGAAGWSHATLSVNAADHAAPAGAKLSVGRSDDGQRGLGVFVCRGAPGSGPNDWKNVALRWRHGADGVADPGTAELKVLGLEMVYVPGGAFWAGDGATDTVRAQFSVGGGTAPFRITSEAALTLGGRDPKSLGNRDGLGMSRAEDFGEVTQSLPAAFPKGFSPFYCMKRQITQGQYVAFLNLLAAAQQELFGQVSAEGLKQAAGAQPNRVVELPPRGGVTRTVAAPVPAVYTTDRPEVACAGLTLPDGAAFIAWAGLRPVTELEFEKACRGPLKAVPNEAASYWGILELSGPLADQVVAVGNFRGRRFAGTHGDGAAGLPAGWPVAADGLGFGIRSGATSNRAGMFGVPTMRSHNANNSFRGVRTAPDQER